MKIILAFRGLIPSEKDNYVGMEFILYTITKDNPSGHFTTYNIFGEPCEVAWRSEPQNEYVLPKDITSLYEYSFKHGCNNLVFEIPLNHELTKREIFKRLRNKECDFSFLTEKQVNECIYVNFKLNLDDSEIVRQNKEIIKRNFLTVKSSNRIVKAFTKHSINLNPNNGEIGIAAGQIFLKCIHILDKI